MEPKKVSGLGAAQTQGTTLPELKPNAEFSLKTKFALANALAGKNYTPEEGEKALQKSIDQAYAKPKEPTFLEQRAESLKNDFKDVKNPIQAAKVVAGRVWNGLGKMNEATGLPVREAWTAGAAVLTGGAALNSLPALSSGLSAGQAVGTVAGLVGASSLASCGADLPGEEHNHYIKPVGPTEYKEVIIEKPIPGPTVHDTIIKEVPGPAIHDTTYINKTDTIFTPGDTVFVNKTDTIIKEVPGPVVHDTIIKEIQLPPIVLPPETIQVNTNFKSEVPEKIKEMIHDLGVDTTGVGQFVYGLDYQDEKNNQIHRQLWDGGRTSRDGDVYIMNEIKTGWDDPSEKYVFGKNEQFQRNELYLSSGNLANCPNTPNSPINVSNGNERPNWYIFNPEQPTAEPGNWTRNNPVSYTKSGNGEWKSSDGFTYKRGENPGEIVKTNSYGTNWLLKNVSIIGGNDAKDPQ